MSESFSNFEIKNMKLNRSVENYAKSKHDSFVFKKRNLFELPAAVVACSYKNSGNIFKEDSGGYKLTHVDKQMIDAYKALGGIGTIPKGAKNTLGRCAEQRGANKICKDRIPKLTVIQNITFSKALRPRTMEQLDYCCNCKTIFSL